MSRAGFSIRLCAAAVLAIWTFAAAPALAGPVELNYAIALSASHPQTLLAIDWAREVEKRTNGALKINIFSASTLTPPEQTYDSVVKGIADIGMSMVSYAKGRFPLTEVIDLPLGYSSGLQATRLANAYLRQFQPKEFDDTKILYFTALGPGVLHTKKPVEKLEDLKGMKIRCTGTSAKIVAALGATPVAMPQPETYDALQKGVVDGVVSPVEALKSWKFAELTKNTTLNHGGSYSLVLFIAMNKQKWNALPKAVQLTVEKVNQEWIEKTGKLWDEIDTQGYEFAKAKGIRFIKLSPAEEERWTRITKPVINDYAVAMKAKGLPGQEALNFCLEWLQKNRD